MDIPRFREDAPCSLVRIPSLRHRDLEIFSVLPTRDGPQKVSDALCAGRFLMCAFLISYFIPRPFLYLHHDVYHRQQTYLQIQRHLPALWTIVTETIGLKNSFMFSGGSLFLASLSGWKMVGQRAIGEYTDRIGSIDISKTPR